MMSVAHVPEELLDLTNVAETPGELTSAAERDEIRQSTRRLLERWSSRPPAVDGDARGSDSESDVWSVLQHELEIPGLIIPEELGGLGLGLPELNVVMYEMGRVLLSSPMLSTAVLGVMLLRGVVDVDSSVDDRVALLLSQIAQGQLTTAFAYVEHMNDRDQSIQTRLSEGDEGDLVVRGSKAAVLDGDADLLLVLARREADDTRVVVAVDGDSDGVHRRQVHSMDPSRPLHHLSFHDARASTLGAADTPWDEIVANALAVAEASLCSEMAGGARRCLEIAVAHAREREQFGRPIGSFQAVKHRCADMLVEIQLAEALNDRIHEVSVLGAMDDRLTSIAKLQSSRAFLFAAHESLHIHGGLGFTWDHPSHRYLRRAKSSDLLFGDRNHHRRVLRRHLTGVVRSSTDEPLGHHS
jgi:alkylation response protein AidB-like acyl-CoA dehydrogenase